MTEHPVHRDDIAALRKEDDLKAYMRSLLRPTKKAATPSRRKPKRTWGAVPIPADHKPGQWPPGTSPPGPAPERFIPRADWDAAERHYSNEINRPGQPCDCGNCQSAAAD